MQLLERVAPLAALTGYADEARQGDGRLLLVAGEAGVGKSALVEQGAPTRSAAAAHAARLGLSGAAKR
jgi:putative ribosome biogenesis GTPase RsgA